MVPKTVMKRVEKLEKRWLPKWLLILLFVVLILRIPSFFEPFSYGDEMIYLTLGNAVRQGEVLYSNVHDNKPPLLYFTAAAAGNVFWFKIFLACWNIFSIVIFAKLCQTLFPKNKRLKKVSTAVFAILTTIPLLEGNIANAELFMVGFTLLGFYILTSQKLNFKNILISGILFSLATLFKIPAAFDIPAIVLFWIVSEKVTQKNLLKTFRKTIILFTGFMIPITFFFVWYYLRGAFEEYFVAAFAQNFGYLSSWRPSDAKLNFVERNMPLLIRFTILFVSFLLLFAKRRKLSKNFIFITSWLLLSLFAVTLSERPYPHYLIQSVPAISLFIGLLFAGKTINQVLVIIPLTITFFVPVYYKFWIYPTLPYYVRFAKFATGSISKEQYFQTFGEDTNRNYKIANFITKITDKNDKVFVWGDSSSIYAISRRLPPIKYVADYHIRDFYSNRAILEKITQDSPKVVVFVPKSKNFPELSAFVQNNYILLSKIEGVEIWKIISPEARSFLSNF